MIFRRSSAILINCVSQTATSVTNANEAFDETATKCSDIHSESLSQAEAKQNDSENLSKSRKRKRAENGMTSKKTSESTNGATTESHGHHSAPPPGERNIKRDKSDEDMSSGRNSLKKAKIAFEPVDRDGLSGSKTETSPILTSAKEKRRLYHKEVKKNRARKKQNEKDLAKPPRPFLKAAISSVNILSENGILAGDKPSDPGFGEGSAADGMVSMYY